MKKFFSKRTLTRIFSVFCVLLLSLSVVPSIYRTFATGFTVSNVTFDPVTGYLSFDYTGDDLSTTPYFGIFDSSSKTKTYWFDEESKCSSSHCTEGMVSGLDSDSGVTSVVIASSTSNEVSQSLNYPLPLPTTYTPQTPTVGGWLAAGETWAYASADAPTYTFTVSGDDTGKYSPGMRVKLTQTTDKYFIITGVSYSSGTTTVTVYGGTDYTLANASITSPYFSMVKAPVGFPLDPTKWTVEVIDNVDRYISTPAINTWYNPNAADQITIPVGAWSVEYFALPYVYKASSPQWIWYKATLSTGNNTESDTQFTATNGFMGSTAGNMNLVATVSRRKTLVLTSKTLYYLNISGSSGASSIDTLSLSNSSIPLVIRAICTYL